MRVEPVNDNALPKEGILGGAAGLATKKWGIFNQINKASVEKEQRNLDNE